LVTLRSALEEYHKELVDGYWVAFELLAEACSLFTTYMPPGHRLLRAALDTTWAEPRKKAYVPPPPRLLRLQLEGKLSSRLQ